MRHRMMFTPMYNAANDLGGGITVEVPKEDPSTETPKGRTFTEEEVERIRRQEKDKLYKQIEAEAERVKSLEEQMKTIAAEREAARKEAEERARQEQELLRQREAEEMSAKDLLSKREEEWQQRINTVEQEFNEKLTEMQKKQQAQEALLERERELQALESYRQRRVNEEQESIIPELIDLVAGNSPEEIEQSIAVLRDRSAAIIDSIQQATASRPRGVAPTAPATGPVENNSEYQTLTADQIRDMPMDQYRQMRERLLAATRQPRGRF